MITFIKKVIVFFIPLLLVYAFPLTIYILGKEYIPLSDIVKRQYEDPSILYGFSYYGEPHVPYKMLLVQAAKPDIIVFGSSRSFQIRKEFFITPDRYVNAAVPRPSIGDLGNMQIFINALPRDGKERTLFLLLDKRFFTEEYPDGLSVKEDSFVTKFTRLSGKPLRLIYLDYFSHRYTLHDLISASLHTNNIGLWSLIAGSGYRIDGSHKEGYYMNKPDRKSLLTVDIHDRVEQIKNYDPELLQKEESLIPQNLQALRSILSLCKERNIRVVGFIPPDPIAVAQEIHTGKSPYAQSQIKLVQRIASTFSLSQVEFFDLSDITLFGGKDDEFIDLIHGGDLVYARLFLYMAKQDISLNRVIDVHTLEKVIQDSKGDFLANQ
jgi:hypothetical protein